MGQTYASFTNFNAIGSGKLGGTNILVVPELQKLGGLVLLGPHGGCAYARYSEQSAAAMKPFIKIL